MKEGEDTFGLNKSLRMAAERAELEETEVVTLEPKWPHSQVSFPAGFFEAVRSDEVEEE